jgi:hypothetical protein
MTVPLDSDLLAPMLAGWQIVADCYGLRAYVFRAAGKIFAVTNEEQGFGELVTIKCEKLVHIFGPLLQFSDCAGRPRRQSAFNLISILLLRFAIHSPIGPQLVREVSPCSGQDR